MSGTEPIPFFYQPLPESPPLPSSQNLPHSFMQSPCQINHTICGTSLYNYYCADLPSVLRHNVNEVENNCVNEVENNCVMNTAEVEESKEEENEERGMEEVDEGHHHHRPGEALISGDAVGSSATRSNGIDAEKYVESGNPYFIAKLHKGRADLHIPKALIGGFSLNLPQTITVLCCEHVERNEETHIPNNHGMLTLEVREWKDGRECVKGWTSFCSKNKINLGSDVCICEFVLGEDQQIQMLEVHVVKNGQIGVEEEGVNEVKNDCMMGIMGIEEWEKGDSEVHTRGHPYRTDKPISGKRGAARSSASRNNGIDAERYVQSENPYFFAKLRKRRGNTLHIPKALIEGFSLILPQAITLLYCEHAERNEDTHIPNNLGMCIEEVCVSRDGRVCVKGWTSFCSTNKINLGNDVCICEFVFGEDQQIQILVVHVVKNGQIGVEDEGINVVKNDCMMGIMAVEEEEKDDSEEVHAVGHPHTPGKAPISGRSVVAGCSVTRNNGIDAENYVQLHNPYFFAKIRKRRGNTLHIPKALIEDFSLILPQTITLLYCEHAQINEKTHIPNNHGMCTEKVCESKDGRVCVKGWTKFCSTNKINLENDVCICEFVFGEDQQIQMLVVHVLKNGRIVIEDEGVNEVENDCMVGIVEVEEDDSKEEEQEEKGMEEEDGDGSEEVNARCHHQTSGKAPTAGKSLGGAAGSSAPGKQGINAEKFVQPHNPYFIAKLHKRRANELHIPKAVIGGFSRNLPQTSVPQTITLLCCAHVERSEETHIRNNHGICTREVCEWKDDRVFVRGWRSFCIKNKINLRNDMCICEFVLGEDKQIQMLEVHVVKNGLVG
ncbi:hypothetical protein RIF29_32210 [Crotalaria pallida]|uniref:B3 domain-containing protein n=1 Tax=Crotalaria pallida TaxID=3830 RepID=A0AAN9EHW3_CROPI